MEKTAKTSGFHPDKCPTCGSTPPKDFEERQSPGYTWKGEHHECNCEEQILLRKHYLLANIPDQYQRLSWEDYRGPEEVRATVDMYLDLWPEPQVTGFGLEFAGTELGIGKTMTATHIAKELVKRGENVYFTPFSRVLSALVDEDTDLERRLRETNVIILDEVIPPYTDKQRSFFADRFENVIRHRTNYNGITIVTTNMNEDQFKEVYPRVYSLLYPKRKRIEMKGKDARQSFVADNLFEMMINGERKPIQ